MTDVPYSTCAVVDLLDAFSSSEPVPGGGSASALSGAIGASLLIMVAGLPRTKTGTAEEAADLSEASARLRPLRDTLLALMDRDAEAYGRVTEAMLLPKETALEEARRKQAIEQAMVGATEVPLDTMRASQQALRGAVIVAEKGHRPASSDTGVGIELLMAAVRGAAMNIDANVASISDRSYGERVKRERYQLERDAGEDAARARRLL
jgi:glutamate formiminotransferase/formiminotetrahydrofolate cyclodeaminase